MPGAGGRHGLAETGHPASGTAVLATSAHIFGHRGETFRRLRTLDFRDRVMSRSARVFCRTFEKRDMYSAKCWRRSLARVEILDVLRSRAMTAEIWEGACASSIIGACDGISGTPEKTRPGTIVPV